MLTLNSKQYEHPEQTRRALLAAEGYMYLNLCREALKEIESIPKYEQEECDVMTTHVRVLLRLKRWKKAAQLSAKGACLHPDEDEFTVQRVFALQNRKMYEMAARILMNAPEWIRRTGILHYNLGCYQARWGNIKLARQCISAATKLNDAIKKNARKDPDLAELWK